MNDKANRPQSPKHLRVVERERTSRPSDLRSELVELADQTAALNLELCRITREIERAVCSS